MLEDRLVDSHAVRRALSCGRAGAIATMQRLGGCKVPGVGWRVSEKSLERYVRALIAGRVVARPAIELATEPEERPQPPSERQTPESAPKPKLKQAAELDWLDKTFQRAQARYLAKRSKR
jgi:hypothetical protein